MNKNIKISFALTLCFALIGSAWLPKSALYKTERNYTPPITGTELNQYTEFPKRRLVIVTAQGTIKLQLFEKLAPNHVANIIELANSGFYNSTYFHRVVPGFMIQGGDPNTKDNDFTNDGQGNSPSRVNAEFSQVHHARGILSMARANDPNSASCQFFICVAEAAFLDGKYTVFGQVTDGIDIVDKIVNLRDVTTRPHSAISSQGINPGRAAEVFQMAVVEDSSDEKANKKLAAAERKRNQIVVADEAKMKYQEKQATSERKKADALLSPNVIARLASRFKDADQAADIVFHINAALGMEYSSFNPMLLNLAALSGSNDDIKKYFQKELQLNPPLNSLQLESLSQSTGLSYDELTAFQVK